MAHSWKKKRGTGNERGGGSGRRLLGRVRRNEKRDGRERGEEMSGRQGRGGGGGAQMRKVEVDPAKDVDRGYAKTGEGLRKGKTGERCEKKTAGNPSCLRGEKHPGSLHHNEEQEGGLNGPEGRGILTGPIGRTFIRADSKGGGGGGGRGGKDSKFSRTKCLGRANWVDRGRPKWDLRPF